MSITITHSRADFRFLLNDRHLQERNGNLNRKIKYEKIQRYIVTGDSLHGLCLVLRCGNDIRFRRYLSRVLEYSSHLKNVYLEGF